MRQKQMGTLKRLVTLWILAFLGLTAGYAQEIQISGTVVDQSGGAIPGVNVVVKGTTIGSITDIDGNYQLTAKKGDIIKFSFIGFKEQELIVSTDKLNVTLVEESIGLDEVVAVGYGTMRKSDLTGSVARVSADMFKDQNNVSIDQTLAARVAGVQVVSNSGAPGAGVSIRIRGGTSINASNEPLYVIDGIPFVNDDNNGSTAGIGFDTENPMVNIDPSDIESIEVLKDASATAIYGSRGANGVILVTTKSGKSGKTNLVYNVSYGVSDVTNKLDLMNGEQYASFMHEADPTDERFTDPDTGEAISYADSTSVDWQDEVFRAAKVQNHNLSMTGGNDKTRYALSLGYLDNEGVVINTKLSRYSTRMKVEHDYSDFVSIAANYSAGFTEENGIISAGTQSGSNAGVITNLIVYRPTAIYNESGEVDDFDLLGNKTNPLVFANEVEKTTTTLRNVGNVDLKLNFTKDLSLKITGGANINNVKRKQYYPSNVGPGKNSNGKGIQSDIMRIVWLNDNILTYIKEFGKHRINAIAGISMQKSITEKLDVTNTEYDIEQNALYNIGAGTAPLMPSSSREEWALYSYLGRVNYNFNNRYLVTASFRADGSSRFGSNNRYGYFPSFSAAWRVSEEAFMQSISGISNLKLRAGWGQTGNQGIGLFSYLEMLNQANYSFGGNIQTGIQPNNIGNPDLKWETTSQVNVGMDLGLFSNRINFVIDAYDKYTDDLLLNMPLSQVSGYETVMANIGAVSNKGIELAINTVNIDNANFKWFTDFNIAFNENRIEKLVNAGQDIYVEAQYNSTVPVQYVLREGEAVGSMFGYVWDKNDPLYQIDDFTWQDNSNSDIAHEDRTYVLKDEVAAIPGSNVQPGYLKYQNMYSEDVDGDGIITPEEQVIDSEDRQIIGNGLPKHFGGITNTFKYKGFDCMIGFQWSYGNDIYNANKFDYMRPNIAKNQHVDVLNAWTPENTNTTIPSLKGFGAVLPSSFVVEDGSYIRLNNITIGYTLPKKVAKKMRLSKIRVYASGSNLYTWTNYSGFTPDVSVSGGVSKSLLPGLDYSSYPQVMTIMGGLSVNF